MAGILMLMGVPIIGPFALDDGTIHGPARATGQFLTKVGFQGEVGHDAPPRVGLHVDLVDILARGQDDRVGWTAAKAAEAVSGIVLVVGIAVDVDACVEDKSVDKAPRLQGNGRGAGLRATTTTSQLNARKGVSSRAAKGSLSLHLFLALVARMVVIVVVVHLDVVKHEPIEERSAASGNRHHPNVGQLAIGGVVLDGLVAAHDDER